MQFDFRIPRRPVSCQAKDKKHLKEWQNDVHAEAKKGWPGEPCKGIDLCVQLIYLYDDSPVDVDNIIKPILDSLKKLIYDDDSCITDVDSHRRSLKVKFDGSRLPPLLKLASDTGEECVYVRISDAKSLEEYL